MNTNITSNTENIATQALMFAMKIEQIDDLRLLLSAAISIINERPGLSADEYLQALTQYARNHGLIDH